MYQILIKIGNNLETSRVHKNKEKKMLNEIYENISCMSYMTLMQFTENFWSFMKPPRESRCFWVTSAELPLQSHVTVPKSRNMHVLNLNCRKWLENWKSISDYVYSSFCLTLWLPAEPAFGV